MSGRGQRRGRVSRHARRYGSPDGHRHGDTHRVGCGRAARVRRVRDRHRHVRRRPGARSGLAADLGVTVGSAGLDGHGVRARLRGRRGVARAAARRRGRCGRCWSARWCCSGCAPRRRRSPRRSRCCSRPGCSARSPRRRTCRPRRGRRGRRGGARPARPRPGRGPRRRVGRHGARRPGSACCWRRSSSWRAAFGLVAVLAAVTVGGPAGRRSSGPAGDRSATSRAAAGAFPRRRRDARPSPFLVMTASNSVFTYLGGAARRPGGPAGLGVVHRGVRRRRPRGVPGGAGPRPTGGAAGVARRAAGGLWASVAVLPLAAATPAGALAVMAVAWGFAAWAFVPAQQHRLIGLGSGPAPFAARAEQLGDPRSGSRPARCSAVSSSTPPAPSSCGSSPSRAAAPG